MRTVVFPNANNTTFRSGYIKLSAYGSEWDQAVIEGNTAQLVEKLKNTARQAAPDNDAKGLAYLRNAVKNMQIERSKMHGTLKFIGILPLPLAVRDQMSVDWSSAPSAFIDGAYGRIKGAGIGQASTYATATTLLDSAGNYLAENVPMMGWAANGGTRALDAGANTFGLGSGNNGFVEMVNNGGAYLASSVANSPAAQAYMKPGAGTKQILGMKSDQSLMTFHNEAAALNGTRQIIFDPGYWQSFQGVNPRGFTLTWDIIPENHEEAISGLELCARIREFSLPQSVSGVELLSPCYWQIDWSNYYLDSQTLYSNLVIKNIEVDYAQNGEWHGSSTPKMFRITIQFEEAKAPTADIYKNGSSFIDVAVAASGGKGGSTAQGSKGPLTTGKARGGNAGNAGYDGAVGEFGKAPGTGGITDPAGTIGGSTGGTGGGILGTITQGQKVAGSILGGNWGPLDGIRQQIGNTIGGVIDNLAGTAGVLAGGTVGGIGDKTGDMVGGIISSMGGNSDLAKAVGDFANSTIDKATAAGAKVLADAIRTGDFKDLDSRLGDAALNSVAGGLVNTVGGAIGGNIVKLAELIPGVDFDPAVEKLIEGAGKQMIADVLNGDNPFKSENLEKYGNQIINGVVGGYLNPVLEKVEDKLEDWAELAENKVEDFILMQSDLPPEEKERIMKERLAKRAEEAKALEEARKKEAEADAKALEEERKRIIEEEKKKWQEEQEAPKEPEKPRNNDPIKPNGKTIAIGDHIAQHLGTFGSQKASISDGNASRAPGAVKAAILGLNADDLKGSEVFLSTGILKDPRVNDENKKLITEQIEILTKNACMTTVAGVPAGSPNAEEVNKMLSEIIKTMAGNGHRVKFAGTLPENWESKDAGSWVKSTAANFTGCSKNQREFKPYTNQA